MINKIKEYAELLLKCVKVEDKRYLFIEIPYFLNDFIDILKEKVNNLDLDEVHFEITDPFRKHELLITLDQDSIYRHPLFDKSIYNKYAKLDAAFIFIQSMIPDLMNDVDPDILKNTNLHMRNTQKYFRDLYEGDKLNWCIAAVPNPYWALNGLKMTEEALWDKIFNICMVNGDNTSYEKWIDKINKLKMRADKLNEYQFEYLKYNNSLGTDLKVYLPVNHVWCTGYGTHGEICNLPTEEVFTSPIYNKTEGVVYSSKPLFYNNITIDNFYLKFANGKVVDYDAKTGKDILKTIIENDPNSCYLGECALVSYDSSINNTNIIFKETLYDENASCHLALGTGFYECLKDIPDNANLLDNLVNVAKIHVDFMIGTSDLSIIGVTSIGEEVEIMKNGNLII